MNNIEKKIESLVAVGPGNAPGPGPYTLATIELVGGFELFNNRPYHCYETWCKGFRITVEDKSVMDESLDRALDKIKKLIDEG